LFICLFYFYFYFLIITNYIKRDDRNESKSSKINSYHSNNDNYNDTDDYDNHSNTEDTNKDTNKIHTTLLSASSNILIKNISSKTTKSTLIKLAKSEGNLRVNINS